MALKLYTVHNSHPCVAVARALEMKGLSYTTIEWPPPLHPLAQTVLFGVRTVPALRIDGEKISGSRAIMHRLDELAPEPPLYPADPAARAAVEEADLWGDTQFQQVARDLIWVGVQRHPGALVGYSRGGQLALPATAVRLAAPAISRAGAALNRTNGAKVAARIAALPEQFDRIDAWIAAGVIGDAEHPNAADLQILSTVRLIASFADVRPLLDGRPCLAAARAVWPPLECELPAGALR